MIRLPSMLAHQYPHIYNNCSMKLDLQAVPIHHQNREKQGTLYHKSTSHVRHLSVDRKQKSTPYVELLAGKTSRSQKGHTRQGAGSFSYRRWFESPAALSLKEAVTDRDLSYPCNPRPQTEQLIRIRKLRQESPTAEETQRDSLGQPSRSFRRTLKGLRDKVRQRIKIVAPKALEISQVGVRFSQKDLLMCNKIVPWKQQMRRELHRHEASLFDEAVKQVQ